MKYEGRLLNLGTVDSCNRKFSENCEITFPEKIPVTYNFQSELKYILGNAEISRDDNSLSCRVTIHDDYFTGENYYVGGCYGDVEKHKEGDITIIDSCRLVSMSIVPDNQCCDKNMKISRVEE